MAKSKIAGALGALIVGTSPAALGRPAALSPLRNIMNAIHFERTGVVLEDIGADTLVKFAHDYSCASTERDRQKAAGVLAKAGWFRKLGSPLPQLPSGEPEKITINRKEGSMSKTKTKPHPKHKDNGERSPVKADRVFFEVEKHGKDVKVSIKDKPKTSETFKASEIKESLMKLCYGYTDKHIGTKDKVGNKGGSLYNRIRALIG